MRQDEERKAVKARQEFVAKEEHRRQTSLAFNTRIKRLQEEDNEMITRVAAGQNRVPASLYAGPPNNPNAL